MEGTRQTAQEVNVAARHFREQAEAADQPSIPTGVSPDAPLEVNMTDEPGGDPYNHTGSFKRIFR